MPYTKTAWVNGTTPALSATNLNHVETGIAGATVQCNLATEYGLSTAATAAANATALQLAITDEYSSSSSYELHLPGANYTYTSPPAGGYPISCGVVTLKPGTAIVGDGPETSMFLPAAGGGDFITYDTSIANGRAITLRNFGVDGYSMNASTGRGIYLPTSVGGSGSTAPWFVINNIVVKRCWGTGAEITNAGGALDNDITDLQVYNCSGVGIIGGSDSHWRGCEAANNGLEGFSFTDKTSAILAGCKAYSNGTVTAARGIGFKLTGEGAGVSLSGCYAQDNFAQGVLLTAGGKFIVEALISENNSQSSAGTYSGLEVNACHDYRVTMIGGDRLNTSPTKQTHSLKVVSDGSSTQVGGSVWVAQAATNGSSLGTVIDSASTLLGCDVRVAGSHGGQVNSTFASTITPNPYSAMTWNIGTLTGTLTVAAPSNAHTGCPLRLILTQDGTGGRNVTLNSIYKTAYTNTGNTASKRCVIDFTYDGSNWIQTQLSTWF